VTRVRRMRARLGGERGYVVPAAVAVLAICLLLLAAAATRSISANDTSRRAVMSERALQAADSGLRVAQLRQNGLGLDLRAVLNLSQQCIVRVGSILGVADLSALGLGATWCGAMTEDLGNNTSYTYYASGVVDTSHVVPSSKVNNLTLTDVLGRTIVSIGTACLPSTSPCVPGAAGSVSRRVRVDLKTPTVSIGFSTIVLGLTTTLTSSLQLYTPVKGTYRECSPAYPSSFSAQSPDC
jgi:type II secretory pathway pseudopilin PulG